MKLSQAMIAALQTAVNAEFYAHESGFQPTIGRCQGLTSQPTLTALEKRGLLRPVARDGDRPLYRLTAAGWSAVADHDPAAATAPLFVISR